MRQEAAASEGKVETISQRNARSIKGRGEASTHEAKETFFSKGVAIFDLSVEPRSLLVENQLNDKSSGGSESGMSSRKSRRSDLLVVGLKKKKKKK